MKILILASDPRKDLNLDREIRDLRGVIKQSRHREQFEVVDELAVTVERLQELLLEHKPQIVHFCGHGSGEQGLVLEREEGGEQPVQTEALSNLLKLICEIAPIECVLLNACYSETQANVIVEHIDYVIGMRQEIQDKAAIAFSKGFYRALGYDCSIEQSYGFGCNAIQLELYGSSRVRSVASEAERRLEVVDAVATTQIPEHLKPILKKRTALIQKPNAVLPDSKLPLSSEAEVAIQLDVAAALQEEKPSLKQFRDQVREYLEDRQLEDHEKVFLEQSRQELGLSIAEAQQILDEEQAPILAAQQAYRNRLNGLIQSGLYPFSPRIEAELKKFQNQRNLTDAEVKQISQPVFEQAEAEYQVKLQQQTQEPEQQQLEQQQQSERQQLEQQRKQEDVKQSPPLKRVEFQIPRVNIGTQTIEKPGFFGKKTEMITTCNVTYQRGQAEYFVEDLGNGVILEMVSIPGGTFMMGSPDGELNRLDSESPQHQVTIQPFFIDKFAVTQAQWKAIAELPKVNRDLDPDPSGFKGNNRPVERVSWHNAIEFCDRLSQKTGKQYRLPSEAEWEYACRAGTKTPFYCGETIITDLANYRGTDWEYKGKTYPGFYDKGPRGSYRQETTEVGSFSPNAFGLYDMHGNVWEWCADHWHENYQGAPIDGSTWITGGNSNRRLVRGGSWVNNPRNCRSACRIYNDPDGRYYCFGFRVVCGLA